MKRTLLVSFFILIALTKAYSQEITGFWVTYDDKTKQAASKVEITLQNGKYFARIMELYNIPEEYKNPRCINCTGKKKDQPIIGLYIIEGAEKEGSEVKGTILDPDNGKEYKSKLWIDKGDPKILNVRGYLGPFHRTQLWKRAEK